MKIFAILLWPILAIVAQVPGNLLDVPFVRQQEQGCGPATVAMVIQYWANHGADVDPQWLSPRAIYGALYTEDAGGVSGEALAGFLGRQGFQAFAIRGAWRDLTSNLARGRPVIVALQPGESDPIHFVLLVGTSGEGEVVFHDPAREAQVRESAERFRRQWERTNNWTLIAAPRRLADTK